MHSEIELFLKGIKPTLLLTYKGYEANKQILKNFKRKEYEESGYLIYNVEEDIEGKNLGEILGYHPESAKTFEEKRNEPKADIIISKFINYGGIQFNCFDYYKEAMEWCKETYKEKLLNEYGSFKVYYYEVEFTKNYVGGYDRKALKLKKTEVH